MVVVLKNLKKGAVGEHYIFGIIHMAMHGGMEYEKKVKSTFFIVNFHKWLFLHTYFSKTQGTFPDFFFFLH